MDWQVENLAYDATAVTPGDQITMDIIASGCDQSGHWVMCTLMTLNQRPGRERALRCQRRHGSMSMRPRLRHPKALTSNSFTKASYAFSGWNTLANGTALPMPMRSYPFTAVATLYAHGRSTAATP